MCKTISHAFNACSFKYKLCLVLKMKIRYRINIWKRCLVKHSIENKLQKTFLVNNKNNHKNKNKKYFRRGCYGTDTIPLSQTALFDIKCFFVVFFIESFNICTNHVTYNIKMSEIGLYLHNIDPKEVTFIIHYIFRST